MNELAYVLINPYSIRKSRTGGILTRYLGRTDLRLVSARMFGPSREMAERYADAVRDRCDGVPEIDKLIADYVMKEYAPNKPTGRPHRCMCLLFEGEDAIRKIWEVTGSVTLRWGCGQTVRETYGDYIQDASGTVTYFEPAVLVGPTKEFVQKTLRIIGEHIPTDSGLVNTHGLEQTLVMLKPDNFQRPSLRVGNIIDLLSSSGLRIVAVKKFSMTVAQAERFYGPVVQSLESKFPIFGASRVANAVSRELGIEVTGEEAESFCRAIAPKFARDQFEMIVEFMTGYKPSAVLESEKPFRAGADSLALIYEGENAIAKIRDILGATDPLKARPGSIRREFGTNVMVNAAHASDSAENARREMTIIDIHGDNMTPYIKKYCYE
ncbi:MAG: nucleoside-diphosphate kinase [Kiritimatiellia bacterium]|jgi:nucleoside diphosphate kinase